jgi:hypothetical protein
MELFDSDTYKPGDDPNYCKDFGKSFIQICKDSIVSISPIVYLLTIIQQIIQFILSSNTIHTKAKALAATGDCGSRTLSWVWLSYQNLFIKVADSGGALIGIVGVMQLIIFEQRVSTDLPRPSGGNGGGCCSCCCCCKKRGFEDNEDFCAKNCCAADLVYSRLVVIALIVSLTWFIPLLITHILVGILTYLVLFALVMVVIFAPAILLSRCFKMGLYGPCFKYSVLFFLTAVIQASSHYAVLLYDRQAPINWNTYLDIISDEFLMRNTYCYFYGIYTSYSPTALYELFLHLGI